MIEVQNTGNWREVIRKNQAKTRWVIFLFILLFLCLGLAIDYIRIYLFVAQTYQVNLSIGQITQLLLHGEALPYGMFFTTALAIVWVGCTFLFYHKIMLSGTQYQLVTPDTQDPLAKRVYNVVEEMKIASNLNFMPQVYLIDADYLNAFASGYSEKNAMIAITRALAESLDRDELQAVLAHELTHIRHQDIKLNLFVAALSNMLLFMLESLYFITASAAFRRNRSGSKETNNGAAMIFLIVVILRIVLPIITMFLTLFLSRTREYMADAGAVQLMRNNEPLARALIKITKSYQDPKLVQAANKQPHERMRRASYISNPNVAEFNGGGMDFMSTHPSLQKRLKAIGIRLKNS